jgi:hypothetical protein
MHWAAAIPVIAVAGLLAVGFATGLGGAEPSPLPLPVEPADAGELLARLSAKGVASAGYDPDSRRILVSGEDERKAIIALAEERILGEAYQYGFVDMLVKWAFPDGTELISDDSLRQGLASEVARLIESMDGIAEASVLYSADFGRISMIPTIPKPAVVRVKLERAAPLGEEAANTIVSIVAAAKHGVDPRNVSVVDQLGNKFHSRHGFSSYSMQGVKAIDKRRWDIEFSLNEELRIKLERLVPQYVPNIEYEGDVTAFPRHEVEFYNGCGERSVGLSDIMEPHIEKLTIFVIIHLPYRYKRDGEGRLVQQANKYGEALFDPKTRTPLWERESAEPLSYIRIEELMRQIAHASGISWSDNYDRIEIVQIPWTAPAASGITKRGSFSMLLEQVLGFFQNGDTARR